MDQQGQIVRWRSINKVFSGILESPVYKKKDNSLLGYLVRKKDGRYVIVHPKSFIQE
jgi:hypothetical protein